MILMLYIAAENNDAAAISKSQDICFPLFYITVLRVNYGIPNTMVFEMP